MNRKPCPCKDCLASQRRDDNVERARQAPVSVICVKCGGPAASTVDRVLSKRGLSLCEACGRRRKS